MSPVSRGRAKKKHRSSKGPRGGRAPARQTSPPAGGDSSARVPPSRSFGVERDWERPNPQFSALETIARTLTGAAQARAEATRWWPDSHLTVLNAATALLDCATPTVLEDAVCDLFGRHWHGLHEVNHAGLREDVWLEGLLQVAQARAAEPGVRRLLYGIALIATPGLAGMALDVWRDNPTGPQDEGPAWLDVPPTLTASPDVLLLRDGYGLRFGVLSHLTGPSGQPRTYLFDVDLCHGYYQVLDSGYYPDDASAATAWRGMVGASAVGVEPVPAPDDLLPHVLPGSGMRDGLFARPLAESHFTEIYRGDRIVHVVADALRAAGRPIAWPSGDRQQASELASSLSEEFTAWAARSDVAVQPSIEPDDDIVNGLIDDWVSPGMTRSLALACSPHRIAVFTAYLVDDWRPEQLAVALRLLHPWVRFCLENSAVTGQFAEDCLAWARRAEQEPDVVGGDLGNYLNRRIDETTLIGPPIPAHAR